MSSAVKTFQVVEGGKYNDLEAIYPSFVQDYIFSTELKNLEIKEKYDLSHGEFKEMCDTAKKQFGISRRRTNLEHSARYYYKHNNGFVIGKTYNNCYVYLGFVTDTEEIVKKVVELCKKASWDIDVCRHIIRNYGDYLCLN